MALLLSLAVSGSLFVGFLVGFITGVAKERKHHATNMLCHKGVYTLKLVGSGTMNKGERFTSKVLVTELENLGNGYSRVRIDSITGLSSKSAKEQAERIMGDIVRTDQVEWSDDLALLE